MIPISRFIIKSGSVRKKAGRGGRTPAQGFFDDRGKAGDFRSCQKGAGHFMKLTGINPFTRPIPYENEIYFINDCALLWSQY